MTAAHDPARDRAARAAQAAIDALYAHAWTDQPCTFEYARIEREIRDAVAAELAKPSSVPRGLAGTPRVYSPWEVVEAVRALVEGEAGR